MLRMSPDGWSPQTNDGAPREHRISGTGPGGARRAPRNSYAMLGAIASDSTVSCLPGGSRGSIADRHGASGSLIPAQASRAKLQNDQEVPVLSLPQQGEGSPPRTSTPRCRKFLPASKAASRSVHDHSPSPRFSSEARVRRSALAGRILGRERPSRARTRRARLVKKGRALPSRRSRHHFPDATGRSNPRLVLNNSLVDLLPAVPDRFFGTFD